MLPEVWKSKDIKKDHPELFRLDAIKGMDADIVKFLICRFHPKCRQVQAGSNAEEKTEIAAKLAGFDLELAQAVLDKNADIVEQILSMINSAVWTAYISGEIYLSKLFREVRSDMRGIDDDKRAQTFQRLSDCYNDGVAIISQQEELLKKLAENDEVAVDVVKNAVKKRLATSESFAE